MRLSNITIEKTNSKKGLIGFANFTVDDKFSFKGIAVFKRLDGGIRLSWPEKKRGIKKVKTASPIRQDDFNVIESQILEAINKAETTHENNHITGVN